MDGNEKDLSAKREGRGGGERMEKAGVTRETPKGVNKRTSTSLVTPIERNLSNSNTMSRGANNDEEKYNTDGTIQNYIVRNVLIDYECEEYGDCIIDEISNAVGIPTTTIYYEE